MNEVIYPLWMMDKFYYKWDKNILRVGTDDTGSWNITDTDGKWEYMISICSGTNSLSQIIKKVISRFETNENEIMSGVNQLKNTGCLVFLKSPYRKNAWTERYKTNISYFMGKDFNGFAVQKKLNSLNVTVLGLGGGGFTILSDLISLGIENIHIVDFDCVEESNLNRQVHFTESDIGKYKVDVGVAYAQARNKSINITKSYKKISSVRDAEKEIKNADWVFCCMDEPAYVAQRIVNRACYNEKKPVVYGFCQKENGRTFIVDPYESGCVDCLFSQVSDNHFKHMVKALKNSDFKPVTSATAITISLLCDLMIKNWLDLLIYKKPNLNQIIRLDFSSFNVTKVVEFKKNTECLTCGNGYMAHDDLFSLIPIK
ncbi:ThiF family adenylyltransferase [Holzapfeliella sp. JNUCC 80]